MPRKQIVQFDAAVSIAGTDRLLLQQGAEGTEFTHGTVAQLLSAGLVVPSREIISAAGTNQATATVVSAQIVVIETVASGTGIKLIDQDADVLARGVNDPLVYPPVGGQIENLGTNNPATIFAGGAAKFLRTSANTFRIY